MNLKPIGEIISDLRKEKGVTQEELGKAVGVSTQAVSKWECGGEPDIALIPLIADYFQISIDKLFGRNINDYSDIETATAQYIASFPIEERIQKTFELCWILQKSINGVTEIEEHNSLKAIREKNIENDNLVHSQMLYNSGITLMSLKEELPYFFIAPESSDDCKTLFENIDYESFFQKLADPNIFKTLLLLYKRENKPFTLNLIVKKTNVSKDKAEEIISSLQKISLISTSEVELDDEVQKIYNFEPNPAFIALLIFAREMISKPNMFYWYCESRNTPYLK